jgi:hypothetical protein
MPAQQGRTQYFFTRGVVRPICRENEGINFSIVVKHHFNVLKQLITILQIILQTTIFFWIFLCANFFFGICPIPPPLKYLMVRP